MKKPVFLFFILLSFCLNKNMFSQNTDLHMSLDIQSAYNKETRDYSGKPGENYWVNKSKYKIQTSIDPETRKLTGKETVTYFNNSRNNLSKIVLRLYQDFYKKGNARDFQISPQALTDGVDLGKIFINEKQIEQIRTQRNGTNLTVFLDEPVKPDSNITISIDWSFIIPIISPVRMGAYDSTSFFIALWYPQISVYDDIDGWSTFSYTGQQEFYNDQSSFEVEITVPKEYIVWATGTLTNPEEVLAEEYVDRFQKAKESDDVINIITKKDRAANNITLNKTNTWKYKAPHVPDFAFGISNKYLWDLTSVVVDKTTKRRVLAGAAYNENSEDFYEVAEITRDAVKLMSTELPGVPFPYPAATIFNGGGSGMEFPMIINDPEKSTRASTVGVTVHELIHQYFPFYTGTNETKYAWMDEGWARMLQFDIQKTIEPSSNRRIETVLEYSNTSGREYEVPPMVLSSSLKGNSYRPAAYTRPAMAYQELRNYLGDEKFKTALREYIKRWHGKHPTPFDFFFTFNEVTGENLSWFWKPWFFEFGYPDLGIKEVMKENENLFITVEKTGNIPVPISIKIHYLNGDEKIISKKIDVWKNSNEIKINLGNETQIERIQLGGIEIPDANSSNNYYVIQK